MDKANPIRGEIALKDADEHVLVYTTNSIIEMEEELGLSIQEIGAQFQDVSKLRMKFVRSIFAGGLREKHPDIDDKKAGAIMHEIGGLTAGALLISRGLAAAFGGGGDAPDGEADPPVTPPTPAADGTGASYSETGAK